MRRYETMAWQRRAGARGPMRGRGPRAAGPRGRQAPPLGLYDTRAIDAPVETDGGTDATSPQQGRMPGRRQAGSRERPDPAEEDKD
jgi:hypothetical protein